MAGPLLSASTLSMLRAIDEGTMVSEADLIAFGETATASGGTVRTPYVVATVPCRLANVGASIPLSAEQLTDAAEFQVALPILTDTLGVERLVVRGMTTEDAPWAVSLIVTGVLEPRSYAASRKLRAKLSSDIVAATGTTLYPRLTLFPSTTLFPAA